MTNVQFIATEYLGGPGEEGERITWEAVIKAFRGHDQALGFLNYTYFDADRNRRLQPDILLATPDLGLIVIEVKTFGINRIARITGNRWMMAEGFYSQHIDPFRQGENQARQIIRWCSKIRALQASLSARVIVALPLITRQEWIDRGFEHEHHACPPIIFGDELGIRALRLSIENNATIIENAGRCSLDQGQWMQLSQVLLGHPKAIISDNRREESRTPTNATTSKDYSLGRKTRKSVLLELNEWMSDVDRQQARIAMQIPPGPQRIRGIAGSGKTVLLCQKAARMHIQHPEWQIALIFFTRSLYELIPSEINKWLRYYGDPNGEFDLANGNLKVLHAWGSRSKPGFYSILRDRANRNALVGERRSGRPEELLASACSDLLADHAVEQIYDAVLIDEGQDLSVDESRKYEDKQAVFWLAWQSLRPVSKKDPSSRRLIWAYDEAQSLHSLKIPSYEEVFGRDLGLVLSGKLSGPMYRGRIPKSEIMRKCYRTPGPILTAAHGIGMGLLRLQGLISGYSDRREWNNIGYHVTSGDFRKAGNRISIVRPEENSPSPVPALWGDSVIDLRTFATRELQLDALVEQIRQNTRDEGLNLSRDQLIILIGHDRMVGSGEIPPRYLASDLQRRTAIHLQRAGINFYVPGCSQSNALEKRGRGDPDRFWHEDAITICTTYFAKGHEAPFVYLLGLEALAEDESDITLRNQLFVALTRSRGWASMSGIAQQETGEDYILYEEIRKVLAAGNKFEFIYRRPSLAERARGDGFAGDAEP